METKINIKKTDIYELAASLLQYDPSTGFFTWRVSRQGTRGAGMLAGSREVEGYLVIKLQGSTYKAHRLAWLLTHGEWPQQLIDHQNGDKMDNRISNLRLATISQNQQNKRLQSSNKSGCAGVSWNKRARKWLVQIGLNNKLYRFGCFTDLDSAIEACREAKLKLHGSFSGFNL